MHTIAIFGCGNLLVGDDGFGPTVIKELTEKYTLPQWVTAIDAMTGIREYLFDYLLSEKDRPDHIIILDAVDFSDRTPGEVFFLDPSSIPLKKIHDFSLHQFPTVNLLHELEKYTGIKVTILAAQAGHIPSEIRPGLSKPMAAAVPKTCKMIMNILSENTRQGDSR